MRLENATLFVYDAPVLALCGIGVEATRTTGPPLRIWVSVS